MKSSITDSILRIEFESDLLSTNIAALRIELLAILEQHGASVRGLVADIAQAEKIDSQGLNLLVALLREAERRKITFRVEKPNPDIRRMLMLLNLGERFGIGPAQAS